MHLFGPPDRDSQFELPGEREWAAPIDLLGVRLHTNACSGLARVRTELVPLLVIPSLAPHPVEANRQPAGHRYFGDLSSPPHGKMKILASPLGVAAHRDSRCLDEQKPQQRVALFADVSQPATLPTGFFRGH